MTEAEWVERMLSLIPDPGDRLRLAARLDPPWRARQRRLDARDDALRTAATLLGPATSGDAAAKAIAAALRQYSSSAWRFERRGPPPADRLHALLHRAMTFGAGKVPGASQCRRILAGMRVDLSIIRAGNGKPNVLNRSTDTETIEAQPWRG
jgi:hypothetical protein